MSLVAYAQPDKRKSGIVLEAFAAGCGGRMASTGALELEPGAAAFYGVRTGWLHLLEQARREGRDWYYVDNAFTDAGREQYFRVGRNALQSWSRKPSDGKRLAALGVTVQPWTRAGRHVLICPQSYEFMTTLAGRPHWLAETVGQVQTHTERPVILRAKGSTRALADDLRDAWLVVAHSSAIAVEALIAGVPVIVTDPDCASAEFGSTFVEVDEPRRMDGRGEWLARLADSQWTLSEMRSGRAWAG